MLCSCGNIHLPKSFLTLTLLPRVGPSRLRWKRCLRPWSGVCELRCCVGSARAFHRGWSAVWTDSLFSRCLKGHFYIDVDMRKWNSRNVLWTMYNSNLFFGSEIKIEHCLFLLYEFHVEHYRKKNDKLKQFIWFFLWWYNVISIAKFLNWSFL